MQQQKTGVHNGTECARGISALKLHSSSRSVSDLQGSYHFQCFPVWFPSFNRTIMGSFFSLQKWSEVKVAQSCLAFCNLMDYTVHGIIQAKILERVPFHSPGDLPNPGIEPRSPVLQTDSLPAFPKGKALSLQRPPESNSNTPVWLLHFQHLTTPSARKFFLGFNNSLKPFQSTLALCPVFGSPVRASCFLTWALALHEGLWDSLLKEAFRHQLPQSLLSLLKGPRQLVWIILQTYSSLHRADAPKF